MGILSALLGDQNPVASWANQNHGLLSQWGAGLASGPTFGQGLANAAQMGPAGQLIDEQHAKAAKEEADRQAKINQSAADLQKWPDLVKYVTDTGDTAGAFSEAFKRSAPGYGDPNYGKAPIDPTSTYQGRLQAGQDQGLSGRDLSEFALTGKLPGGNQTARAGVGQPIPMRNKKTGELVGVQPMTVGPAVNTLTGQPLDNPEDYAYDPAGLAADKTNATVDAKTAAAARAALPGAQQAFDIANKAADALLGDTAGMADQFGNTLGFPNQMFPMARPGSDMARFRTELEQGQGNAFLQARQVLKGAGQVTDYEGAKAEAAYSRMALAAKNNNQQEFVAAVQDFKQAVAEGYAKLRAAAQGDYAAGGPGVTGQGGNVPSAGKVLTYNPATGELE